MHAKEKDFSLIDGSCIVFTLPLLDSKQLIHYSPWALRALTDYFNIILSLLPCIVLADKIQNKKEEDSMEPIQVDHEKCKRDGICAAVCPLKIIDFSDKEKVPVPTPQAAELCIDCGHCVAACPHGALSQRIMKPEDCEPVPAGWGLEPEQVKALMRARRSIRTYKDKQVDREILTELIDMVRYAPSGHNFQPVKWLIVYDTDEVNRMAGIVIDWMRSLVSENSPLAELMHMDQILSDWDRGINRVSRGAPHLIVAHAPPRNGIIPPTGIIAPAFLELAAPSFGLGTCWFGYFMFAATTWAPLIQALNLPEEHVCAGVMMVGYPKYKYHRIPLRNEADITWR